MMDQYEELTTPTLSEEERAAHMARYRQLLASHDWEYEQADDSRVWRKGRLEWRVLIEMRTALDPKAEVWNEFAPAGFKLKGIEA